MIVCRRKLEIIFNVAYESIIIYYIVIKVDFYRERGNEGNRNIYQGSFWGDGRERDQWGGASWPELDRIVYNSRSTYYFSVNFPFEEKSVG